MFREAEVFTLSGESVHFDRNMHPLFLLIKGFKGTMNNQANCLFEVGLSLLIT